MTGILILKWLHILSMFAAVTLLFAPDIIAFRAAAVRDVPTLRSLDALTKRIINVGVALFFTGIGFGVLTAWRGGFGFFAPWLIIAYVLVALLIVIGAAIMGPYLVRISEAARRSGEQPSEELERLLRSPRRYLTWVSTALYVAVIFDMVLKPFS